MGNKCFQANLHGNIQRQGQNVGTEFSLVTYLRQFTKIVNKMIAIKEHQNNDMKSIGTLPLI